jgi:hypothetical protein
MYKNFGHEFGNGMGISIVWSSLINYPTQIYYSVLLYLIQKLATLSSLQQHCTITTTHDKLSCWTGIGSSLSTLYNQFSLPVSLSATLSITAYLLALSALNVTTPALLSVEMFNFLNSFEIPLQGGPQWPSSHPK